MLDFPSPATTGQTFPGPNGVIWQWDSSKWIAMNSGGTTFLPLTGGTLTGPLIQAANPVNALGTATKQYVDHIRTVGFTVAFPGKPAATAHVNSCVAFPVSVAASLAGSQAYGGTVATADTTFTVNQISAGVTTALGTIVLHATGAPTLAGAGGTLAAGDVLQILAPAQDATLADVGITVMATRT
jgi:hypothetical protein